MSLVFNLTAVFLSIVFVVILTSKLKFNSFISLLLASLLLGIFTSDLGKVVEVLKHGFGETLAHIGLIIILGTTIGESLEKSGGAKSIAAFILKLTGEKRTTRAMFISGFVTGMPIFCDSGFIVLSGISKSLALKSGVSRAILSSALAGGLYVVHCLIPPHPGATAANGLLQSNIGMHIIWGLVIAIPVSIVSYLWIKFLAKKEKPVTVTNTNMIDEESEVMPNPLKALMVIFIPLVLISIKAIVSIFAKGEVSGIFKIINFVGDPTIALLIGVAVSFVLLKKINIREVNGLLNQSIEKAGPIIAIIAAGGMFGAIIKSTQIGTQLGEILALTGLGIFIPFLIASLFKTAQGSSTIAIITAASIVNPMLSNLGLDSEMGKIFTLLALGAGSMMISHANDAFFWVIAKFADLDTQQTLRYYTSLSVVMGLSAIFFIWVLYMIVSNYQI